MSAVIGAAQTASIDQILEWASSMFEWFITQMGSIVTFIVANPAILIMFLICLCGAAIGMFSRIWNSV